MKLFLRIVKLAAVGIWLIIIGIFSFVVHIGGWNAIKRVSLCTRIWGRTVAAIMNLKIRVHGTKESGGVLIVSNHTGYLDILVHAAIFPIRFTPKSEIGKWPFLGWYLGISRPIWVERGSRLKATQTMIDFQETLEHGIPLLVYPEGTTTDGRNGLLPFKSTPFEAVAAKNYPILPIITLYKEAEDGLPLGWYGSMTLLPHLWRVLGYRKIEADVYILPVINPNGRDRKELAKYIHGIMSNEYWRLRRQQEEGPGVPIKQELSKC